MGEVSHGKQAVTIVESIWSVHRSVISTVACGVIIKQILTACYRIRVTGKWIGSKGGVVDYPIHGLLRQVFNPVGGKGHFVADVAKRLTLIIFSRAFAQDAIIIIC